MDVREVVHEVAEQDAVDVRRGPRVRPDVEFSEPVGITEQKKEKNFHPSKFTTSC